MTVSLYFNPRKIDKSFPSPKCIINKIRDVMMIRAQHKSTKTLILKCKERKDIQAAIRKRKHSHLQIHTWKKVYAKIRIVGRIFYLLNWKKLPSPSKDFIGLGYIWEDLYARDINSNSHAEIWFRSFRMQEKRKF